MKILCIHNFLQPRYQFYWNKEKLYLHVDLIRSFYKFYIQVNIKFVFWGNLHGPSIAEKSMNNDVSTVLFIKFGLLNDQI